MDMTLLPVPPASGAPQGAGGPDAAEAGKFPAQLAAAQQQVADTSADVLADGAGADTEGLAGEAGDGAAMAAEALLGMLPPAPLPETVAPVMLLPEASAHAAAEVADGDAFVPPAAVPAAVMVGQAAEGREPPAALPSPSIQPASAQSLVSPASPGTSAQPAMAPASEMVVRQGGMGQPATAEAVTPSAPQVSPASPRGDSGAHAGGDSPPDTAAHGGGAKNFSLDSADPPPFRLESAMPATGMAAGALARPPARADVAATPMPTPPPAAGEAEIPSGGPVADVFVHVDARQRLGVMLSATSADAAQRLRAESDQLRADLGALGTEVEAIRVELRGERGPDGGARGGDASPSQQGFQSRQPGADQQDRPWRREVAEEARSFRVLPAGQAQEPQGGTPAGRGRVDRYA